MAPFSKFYGTVSCGDDSYKVVWEINTVDKETNTFTYSQELTNNSENFVDRGEGHGNFKNISEYINELNF